MHFFTQIKRQKKLLSILGLSIFAIFLCILLSETKVKNMIPQHEIDKLIEDSPLADGAEYHPLKLAIAVNALRKQGKSGAIDILENYIKNYPNSDPQRLFLISICLFPGSSWGHVQMGSPYPPITSTGQLENHSFPLMFSNEIPFLIIQGYKLGGKTSSPQDIINICKNNEIISKDIPMTGFKEASSKLTKNPNLIASYENSDDVVMGVDLVNKQGR